MKSILMIIFTLFAFNAFAQNMPGGGELSVINHVKHSQRQMGQIEKHMMKFIKKRISQCKIADVETPKSIREFYHMLDGEKLNLDPKILVNADKKEDCSTDSTLKKSKQLANCLFYDEIFQKYLKVLTADPNAFVKYVGNVEGDDVTAQKMKNYFYQIQI